MVAICVIFLGDSRLLKWSIPFSVDSVIMFARMTNPVTDRSTQKVWQAIPLSPHSYSFEPVGHTPSL